ncbi:MAG: 50S ribosomal protein L24 [Alphaproteobacteria bacterium]|nr:50S ribosomal protein L24 [Alphaproteobacteria bacterium]
MANRFKKGDKVIVLTGKDRGKTGDIVKAIPQEGRVIVQGINMMRRHTRPSASEAGGIVEKEASIHVSNVAIVDPKENVATRVGFRTLDDGTKVRYAKRSGEVID